MHPLINKSGQKVDPSEVVTVRQVSNAHTSEYVYYECQQVNLTSEVVDCAYEEIRTQAIVGKPSDYKFSVQRIEASLVDVEMFNSDDRVLMVTNTYAPDNLSFTAQVNLGINVTIYNIDQVIPAINEALEIAFNGIVAAYDVIYGPGAWALNTNVAQEPFYVEYDAMNDRLIIVSESENINSRPDAMGLYFNNQMEELFRGNVYTLTEPNRLLFYLPPPFVPSISVSNTASYSTSALWYSVKQIVVISNKLGARLVNIGTPFRSGASVSRSIILDFNYVIDNGNFSPGSRLQYLSNNNRWSDLLGDTPLNDIDFKLFYRKKNEILVPIQLRPGESFSILCLFAKTITH